ncbi:MAG TPA: ABC transporter substrate-binding protein, partial [Methylomirabilota bacterium]|nr:ABC transporter substrate-binding protein [Methylomirabilota bacterium]
MKFIAGLVLCIGSVSFANEAVYRYSGADRDRRLLENARKEGSVVLYTSLAPTESGPLGQAFEKKTGVKVEIFRTISEKVVQRAVTEARARRFAVDVVETNGPEMEIMAREKLFADFHSPHLADLPASAIPSHR